MNVNDLYFQNIAAKWNQKINNLFNSISPQSRLLALFLAPFFILFKCGLHTLSIFINTFEYAFRGFFANCRTLSYQEYFSTIGSFVVINTVNALTLIPDWVIRSFFAIKEGKIDPAHTQYTMYYKIMKFI